MKDKKETLALYCVTTLIIALLIAPAGFANAA
jgi:hypothetical protein